MGDAMKGIFPVPVWSGERTDAERKVRAGFC